MELFAAFVHPNHTRTLFASFRVSRCVFMAFVSVVQRAIHRVSSAASEQAHSHLHSRTHTHGENDSSSALATADAHTTSEREPPEHSRPQLCAVTAEENVREDTTHARSRPLDHEHTRSHSHALAATKAA